MRQADILRRFSMELSANAKAVLALAGDTAYEQLVVKPPVFKPRMTGETLPRGLSARVEVRELLEALRPEQLLTLPVKDASFASAMLAGLWLWHDWLAESHRLSQQIDTPTGSFWHAIMHRREEDFSNSKYWYARCENHPVLASLGAHAATLIDPLPASNELLRLTRGGWDPGAFVDLVSRIHSQPDHPLHRPAVALQQMEWRLLFDYCTRQAVA